jgi:hypothetical protein
MVSVIAFAGAGPYLLNRTQRIAWLREMYPRGAESEVRKLLHNVLPRPYAEAPRQSADR